MKRKKDDRLQKPKKPGKFVCKYESNYKNYKGIFHLKLLFVRNKTQHADCKFRLSYITLKLTLQKRSYFNLYCYSFYLAPIKLTCKTALIAGIHFLCKYRQTLPTGATFKEPLNIRLSYTAQQNI